MSDTIFDKILRAEIPASLVYEDEHVIAFKDISPQAPVHVLVVPRTKFLNLTQAEDQTDAVLAGFMRGISRCAEHLGLDVDGYRVVVNNGTRAQQSVAYVHAHILGGRDLSWPPG